MERIRTRNAACALLIALLAGISAWAQGTAQLSGSVKDPSGAVLPGVEVSATQTLVSLGSSTGRRLGSEGRWHDGGSRGVWTV